MNVMRLAQAERRDLADFLEQLTPDQWQERSLCPEWTVHQVAAHLISYDELGWLGLLARFGKGLLGPGDSNAVGVREYSARSPEDLVALIRRYAVPRGLTAGFGGAIALTDGLIHHQDIRRPLGAPRQIPSDRLVAALRMALRSPRLPARRNARGLRLLATDIDWSHGSGPEVTGPAEAVLLAVSGRPAALPDLKGPGLDVLTGRVAQAA